MTKKQSNIGKHSTHLKEDCQVLLFRFKNEFGKEKSLVEKEGVESRNFALKTSLRAVLAGNSSLDHIIKYSPYSYQISFPLAGSADFMVSVCITLNPVNN